MRTEQNRTEQNRTEQNRTEQNRTEQNRTEQNSSSWPQKNRVERGIRNRTERNAGFTLVEMLIVVAIVAIVAAVAIPTVDIALESARDTADKTNEREAKTAAMLAWLGETKIYDQNGDPYDYVPGAPIENLVYDAETGRLLYGNGVEIDYRYVNPYGQCTKHHDDGPFAGGGTGPHDTVYGYIVLNIEATGNITYYWFCDDVDAVTEKVYPGMLAYNDLKESEWYKELSPFDKGIVSALSSFIHPDDPSLSDNDLGDFLEKLGENPDLTLEAYIRNNEKYSGVAWLMDNGEGTLVYDLFIEGSTNGFYTSAASRGFLNFLGCGQMENFNNELTNLVGDSKTISSADFDKFAEDWGTKSNYNIRATLKRWLENTQGCKIQ